MVPARHLNRTRRISASNSMDVRSKLKIHQEEISGSAKTQGKPSAREVSVKEAPGGLLPYAQGESRFAAEGNRRRCVVSEGASSGGIAH